MLEILNILRVLPHSRKQEICHAAEVNTITLNLHKGRDIRSDRERDRQRRGEKAQEVAWFLSGPLSLTRSDSGIAGATEILSQTCQGRRA